MNPRHGEVWLVDMGLAAKTRPAVVLIADHLNAPRSLLIQFEGHQDSASQSVRSVTDTVDLPHPT
ncbi:MAG: hypothetical protein AAB676_11045 [Verrucomicrobiota bacterium]